MKLPKPTKFYDSKVASSTNFAIERADYNNHKRDKDIEVGSAQLILTSSNGTRYYLVVSDAGVLTTSAV